MAQIISRAGWGARPPSRRLDRITRTRGVKVHYTGGQVPLDIVGDHRRCLELVLGIQRMHMAGGREQPYSDIGYNLVACPHRRVFMGRGPGVIPAANGPGLNSGHYAVLALVGSSGFTQPTDDLLHAILDAVEYLRDKGGAGPEIKGHRDGYSTDCPGPALYAWVKAGAPRPGGGTSSPSPPTTWTEDLVKDLPLLSPGATGRHAKTLFYLLRARGYGQELVDPTVYGPAVVEEVKRFQTDKKLDDDGLVGEKTWPKLLGL